MPTRYTGARSRGGRLALSRRRGDGSSGTARQVSGNSRLTVTTQVDRLKAFRGRASRATRIHLCLNPEITLRDQTIVDERLAY